MDWSRIRGSGRITIQWWDAAERGPSLNEPSIRGVDAVGRKILSTTPMNILRVYCLGSGACRLCLVSPPVAHRFGVAKRRVIMHGPRRIDVWLVDVDSNDEIHAGKRGIFDNRTTKIFRLHCLGCSRDIPIRNKYRLRVNNWADDVQSGTVLNVWTRRFC